MQFFGRKCSQVSIIIFIYFVLLRESYSESNFQQRCDVLEIPESADDPRLLAPWVASVFKKGENETWKYHCGATLTATHVVITAASCVSSRDSQEGLWKGKRLHTKYADLKIVVGLLTSDYYAKRDNYTQEAGVSLVREHRNRQGYNYFQTRNSPTNLAGILLDKEFNLTAYVKPVCLVEEPHSIGEALLLHGEEQAMVAGFNFNPVQKSGQSGHRLENFNFTIQPTRSCLNAYGPHTYYFNVACGKLSGDPGKVLPCFMEGAGLIMRPNQPELWDVRYLFLMGVYTANTATIIKKYRYDPYQYPRHVVKQNTQCTETDTAFFTKHAEYFDWAISHSYCGPKSLRCQNGGCFSPIELCDGIAQCSDKTDESPEVCQNQRNCTEGQFRCAYGACIDNFSEKVCNGLMDCADNSDETNDTLCEEADSRSTVTCPPIPRRKGVVTKCFLPDNFRAQDDFTDFLMTATWKCDVNSAPVGTTASQRCARYYRNLGEQPKSLKCQRNGNWSSSEFLNCIPDCGISEPPKTAHVAGGENVESRGEWPWHATIYALKNGYWAILCGGSLVSTRVILTAGHCVTLDKTAALFNTTDLRVVLGKLRSSYGEKESKFTQEISIERILLEEHYNPNTFESDIALIILKYPVEITSSVRPVCFSGDEYFHDFQLKNALFNNGTEFGTVVGFGKIDEQNYSMDLKVIKLPVVPTETCSQAYHKSVREVRYTWFCGGYTNGSGVCPGDSGGGFVFPDVDSHGKRRYYVQGIVSHAPLAERTLKKLEGSCTNRYELFTKVKPFVSWIQKTINETEIYTSYEDGSILDAVLMLVGPPAVGGIAYVYQAFKLSLFQQSKDMLRNGIDKGMKAFFNRIQSNNDIANPENTGETDKQAEETEIETETETENEASVPLTA